MVIECISQDIFHGLKRKWAETENESGRRGGRYKETGEIPCHERELEIFFGKPDKLRF